MTSTRPIVVCLLRVVKDLIKLIFMSMCVFWIYDIQRIIPRVTRSVASNRTPHDDDCF